MNLQTEDEFTGAIKIGTSCIVDFFERSKLFFILLEVYNTNNFAPEILPPTHVEYSREDVRVE